MVNTIGKMFERIVKQRLEAHLETSSEGLSENQFRFCKGGSIINAIEKVITIVNCAKMGPLYSRELCALMSINVAFNFAL